MRLGELGPLLGYSLARSNLFIFSFAKLISQLIFENGDKHLGKTFSDNFSKNKIGFNEIIFVTKNMRCDDADAMMMQKRKTNKI